uniref:Uncharacterized protein n=1 Tax=Attheya septentrionalis TaxID=420275 RepID=A0A7S2U9B5_9STRA|mmetsp:Transcript_15888/g.28891  ORF Transcript_15888/g.28891 Transcript_15888/m.28891 type:complete len:244 (+) Transcript_15888:103-834(+)
MNGIGNQGLDALAALCGGAAKVQTSNNANNGASSIAVNQAGAPQGTMFPIVPSQSTSYSAHNVGAYGRVLPSNHQHGPNVPFPGNPSGDNANHAESISQFQQAMAAAMNGGFGNANQSGPSPTAALSAFISAGLLNPGIAAPPQQPQADNAQNISYQQYLQYAAAEVAKQAKNGSDSTASSLAQFGLDENSAMALAMASSGQQMPPFPQSHLQSLQGELSFPNLFCLIVGIVRSLESRLLSSP